MSLVQRLRQAFLPQWIPDVELSQRGEVHLSNGQLAQGRLLDARVLGRRTLVVDSDEGDRSFVPYRSIHHIDELLPQDRIKTFTEALTRAGIEVNPAGLLRLHPTEAKEVELWIQSKKSGELVDEHPPHGVSQRERPL